MWLGAIRRFSPLATPRSTSSSGTHRTRTAITSRLNTSAAAPYPVILSRVALSRVTFANMPNRGNGRTMTRDELSKNLKRVGFIGYGLLHLALAWVAAQIALGDSGEEGDQSGAFK